MLLSYLTFILGGDLAGVVPGLFSEAFRDLRVIVWAC